MLVKGSKIFFLLVVEDLSQQIQRWNLITDLMRFLLNSCNLILFFVFFSKYCFLSNKTPQNHFLYFLKSGLWQNHILNYQNHKFSHAFDSFNSHPSTLKILGLLSPNTPITAALRNSKTPTSWQSPKSICCTIPFCRCKHPPKART